MENIKDTDIKKTVDIDIIKQYKTAHITRSVIVAKNVISSCFLNICVFYIFHVNTRKLVCFNLFARQQQRLGCKRWGV